MRKARKLSCACALVGLVVASGCSSPVTPASQGALSMHMAAKATGSCAAGAHWINIPFSPSRGQQTSATSKGNLAVDGVGEMGVSCTVKDNGSGGFNVNGTMKSPATDPQGNRVSTNTLVTFKSSVAPGQASMGSVSLIDELTGPGSTYQSEACIFSISPAQPNDQLGAAPGRMWAAVTCPVFRDSLSSDMTAVCQIETGYIVLENCAQ